MQDGSDRAAVEALIQRFAAGWNAANGAKLAEAFAEDADFTAVNGLRAHGRRLIGEGHDELFRTLFQGVEIAARILSVRQLTSDVAVAEAELTYPGKAILPGVDRALAQYVAMRSPDGWEIVVFRNMAPLQRPVAGPVELQARQQMASA